MSHSILVAHGDNEYVLKSELSEAVIGYKKLIHESLNPTKRPPALIEEKSQEPGPEAAASLVKPVVESAATIVAEKEAEKTVGDEL